MKKLFTTLLGAALACGSLWAGDAVPWSEDFSSSTNFNGWTKTMIMTRGKNFSISSQQLYVAQCANNSSIWNEDIIFFTKNGFELDASKSYKFEFDARHNSDTNAGERKMEFRLYKKGTTAPSATSTDYKVLYSLDSWNYDWTTYSFFFEPETTGDYYLALYYKCNYAGRASYWDNFSLKEGSMDAPDGPTIEVTPDASGILKAQVKVTAPSKTIRGEALTGITNMVILRDGGETKTFTNPTPGQVYTFTDYVAQPGSHTFSAIAHNDKGPGQQSDVTVAIGGSVKTQTWQSGSTYNTYYPYSATYLHGGKALIKFPKAAGVEVEDYRIQTGNRVVTGTPQITADSLYYTIVDNDIDFGTEPMGVQYEVLKVMNVTATQSLGYTNYLCVNNTIPYYPSFPNTESLYAYTSDGDYARYAWQYIGSSTMIGGSVNNMSNTDKTPQQNWLISPGLKLSKDKFYRVRITGNTNSDGVTFDLAAGLTNLKDSLNIPIAEGIPLVNGGFNTTPVSTIQTFLKVPADDMYFIGIKPNKPTNLSSGQIRIGRFDIIEVDPTLPNAPTDVAVQYSATGGNGAKIVFKAPTKAIDGSDVAGLTKVEVYKNDELFETITEGLTPGAEMQVEITVTAGKQDVYTILAFNAAGQGEPATAKALVLNIPYTNTFDEKNSLEGFTFINNVESSNNWGLQSGQARLFTDDAGQDNWMITPPITLQAGYYYPVSLIAKKKEDRHARLDIMAGKAPTAEAMNIVVMDSLILDQGTNIYQGFKEEYFTVPESGQYFIGFHATGFEGRGMNTEIFVDDFTINTSVMGTTPARGKLEIIPAADGSLTAEMRFTAPTKALNGSDLNANSTKACYFYVNGVQNPSRTFNLYPGQTTSVTVDVPADLPYLFSAKMDYSGPLTYQDAFVGINRPTYVDPNSVQLKETHPYGHVVMSWDEVDTDYEGYPMNPELVTYKVLRVDYRLYQGEWYLEETTLGENIKGNTFEFDAVAPTAEQTTQRYAIQAWNSKGEGSQKVLTGYLNVGKPYHIPYVESFSVNGNPGVSTATNDESDSWSHWGIMGDGFENGVNSADNDGYYFALESMYRDCQGTFSTGKVNLGVATRPSLTLNLYNHSTEQLNDSNLVAFKVYTLSDHTWHYVTEPTPVIDLCNGKPGWNKVNVDLSAYNDQVIICGIEATCVTKTFTSFDNIRIWEQPEKDMTFESHNAPMSVTPGTEFNVEVNYVNNGINKDKAESIEMLIDGEKVKEIAGEELAPDERGTVTFTHSFPAIDMALSHQLQFNVVYANDHDASDNLSAPHTIMLVDPNLAPVSNLKAQSSDEKFVTLTWDEPTPAEAGVKTEDFESWAEGSASQFGWTAYDNDRRSILGINNGAGSALVLPGLTAFEPASWAVVDNLRENGLPAKSFPAKSGSKFLLSICPQGGTGSADDWMITPELSGNAQTLKFWIKNFTGYRAGFNVMTSDGSMHLDSFQSDSISAVNVNDWREVSIELPAGTKRAAIRNISYCEDSYMLMIDDVTYEPATTKIDALQGYNVYQEAELVGENEKTNRTHTTANALEEGTYTFAVAAKYANGESKVVPVEVTIEDTGISTTLANGVHVFGGQGCIHITGAEGLTVAVSNLDGVMIANGVMNDSARIAAAKGVYVVNVDGKTYKVMVK